MVPCEAALLGIHTATFQLCPYVTFLLVLLDWGPALRSSFNLEHLLKTVLPANTVPSQRRVTIVLSPFVNETPEGPNG